MQVSSGVVLSGQGESDQADLSGVLQFEALTRQYLRVRQHSADICAPLMVDDYGVQPVADVSPPKWHLAHTSWFYETFLLKPHLANYQVFDDSFEVLFNSYYNGVGEQHARDKRGTLSRPTVDEVYRYREHVDGSMSKLLSSCIDSADRGSEKTTGGKQANANQAIADSVTLGLQHEQQHQELLLADIKYILGTTPVQAAYQTAALPDARRVVGDAVLELSPVALRMHEFAGGLHEIGHAASTADNFSFDNETPRHKQYVEDFRLGNRLVNNAEYLNFIRDGGYRRSELWLSEGWSAVQAGRFGTKPAPLYWRERNGDWYEYVFSGLQPLRANAAVAHISYYEADAYARWAGCRLPSEVEWEIAGSSALAEDIDSPLVQLDNSLWQWTQSAYLPYPGFRSLPGTLGEYNGKFMSGQMVLRGGSLATPKGHTRLTYRNFFYPPDRWQFTGIRLAADAV